MSKETTDHPAQHRDDDDCVVGPGCPPKTHQLKPGQSGNPKPKSKCKPQKDAIPPKWQQVIDLMIIGGLCFQDAMKSVGYSEKYYTSNGHQIKKDARFCTAFAKRQAETKAKTENLREKRIQSLNRIIENPESNDRDVIAAVQVQGRMCGWLSETIRHETTERQAQLDEAARKEAARLAVLVLDTRALPDVSQSRRRVQSVVSNTVIQDAAQDSDVTESATSQDDVSFVPKDPENRGIED
ncbi:hypothetical protein ACFL3F_00890 [Planctomycetota bacterium]